MHIYIYFNHIMGGSQRSNSRKQLAHRNTRVYSTHLRNAGSSTLAAAIPIHATKIWKETFHTKYSLPIIFALETKSRKCRKNESGKRRQLTR